MRPRANISTAYTQRRSRIYLTVRRCSASQRPEHVHGRCENRRKRRGGAVTRTSNAFDRTTDVGSKQKRVVEHGKTETPGARHNTIDRRRVSANGANETLYYRFFRGLHRRATTRDYSVFRRFCVLSFNPRKKTDFYCFHSFLLVIV